MSLREAKHIRVGDKVVVKETGQVLTVSGASFVMAGIGYPQDAIEFAFEETDRRYFHQGLVKHIGGCV